MAKVLLPLVKVHADGTSQLAAEGADRITEVIRVAEPVVNPDGPMGQNEGGDATRRDFIHIAAGAAAAGAGVMVAWPLINQMSPAADTLALASIEFDMSKVQEGQQVVIKWQGKPVFVRYRTPAELQKVEAEGAVGSPAQTDAERTKAGHEKYLVVIGSCTHLGCVPTFNAGEYGGWFCPCHGSHYDASGRIRKGPAPLNLIVPAYEYLSDTRVKIG